MSIESNVVDGAMPKQRMEIIPRKTVTITLRWSLMIDFKHSQNYKGEKKRLLFHTFCLIDRTFLQSVY